MQAIVHAADVQDRDGGVLLMGALFGLYPFLLKLYADGGYQGAKFQDGLKAACAQVSVEIVRRGDVSRFIVLPRRWIVERTIGRLNRVPPPRKGLGVPEPECARFPALGLGSPDAAKALPAHTMISDGL